MKKLDVVPVEGIGSVEGGHHAFGVKAGQAVHMAILGLEEVAAVAQIFHAQADKFHEVGGEGLKLGVGIACLNLFAQYFALAGFIGIAGEQAEVAIFQLFAKLLPGI